MFIAKLRNIYDAISIMRMLCDDERIDLRDLEMGEEDGCRYSDAVEAIMNSDMSDYYKSAVVDLVPLAQSSDFYKAVVSAANAKTSSYYRCEIIKKMIRKAKDE